MLGSLVNVLEDIYPPFFSISVITGFYSHYSERVRKLNIDDGGTFKGLQHGIVNVTVDAISCGNIHTTVSTTDGTVCVKQTNI